MTGRIKLKRKSYFVDERALNRAKKAFGVKTEAEVIRLSVERVAEMEEFWEFMKKIAGLSDPEAWRNPEMAVAILDTRVYIDHWERYIKTANGRTVIMPPRKSNGVELKQGCSLNVLALSRMRYRK